MIKMTREFEIIIVKNISTMMDTIGTYRSFYPSGMVKAGKTNGIFWIEVEIMDEN